MRILRKLNTPLAVLSVAVLVVAVNVLLFFYRYQPLTEPPATDTDTLPGIESTSETFRTSPSSGDATSPDEGEVEPVVVEVVDAPVGFSIYEDGQLVVDEVSEEPGFSQEFEPEESLTISTNNAGAIRTEVGGWDLGPLGADGEAVTRDFTARS